MNLKFYTEDTVNDSSSFNIASFKEVETNKLSKPTRVVVVNSLCISKGFKDRAGGGRERERQTLGSSLLEATQPTMTLRSSYMYMYMYMDTAQNYSHQIFSPIHITPIDMHTANTNRCLVPLPRLS